MIITSFKDLVSKINKDLDSFCDTFRYTRKDLSGSGRAASGGILFKYNSDDRDWVINEGGGVEVQYHLFLRDSTLGYGIGFNAQYVPYANKKSPLEYIDPFVKAYLVLEKRHDDTIENLKEKGFCFLDTRPDVMQYGDYSFFGKCIPIQNGFLSDDDYKVILENLQGDLFELYKKIWEGTKNSIMEYKNLSYLTLLTNSKNVVFTGAPGTGKTYLAKQIAAEIILHKEYTEETEKDTVFKKHCSFVQFHPSYDYTDFVEGLRPENKKGAEELSFVRRNGIFKEFCAKAAVDKDPDAKYIFIIDEINRGELSKIFGELFFSIDPGYRGEKGRVRTQYQNLVEEDDIFNDGFYVPDSVLIIGTMNDIDRSVESMDFAFRRRFAFIEIKASTRVEMLEKLNEIEAGLAKKAEDRMNAINEAIINVSGLSSAYQIGPSYFLTLKEFPDAASVEDRFQMLWKYHLGGLIKEYLRGLADPKTPFKDIANAYGVTEDDL